MGQITSKFIFTRLAIFLFRNRLCKPIFNIMILFLINSLIIWFFNFLALLHRFKILLICLKDRAPLRNVISEFVYVSFTIIISLVIKKVVFYIKLSTIIYWRIYWWNNKRLVQLIITSQIFELPTHILFYKPFLSFTSIAFPLIKHVELLQSKH